MTLRRKLRRSSPRRKAETEKDVPAPLADHRAEGRRPLYEGRLKAGVLQLRQQPLKSQVRYGAFGAFTQPVRHVRAAQKHSGRVIVRSHGQALDAHHFVWHLQQLAAHVECVTHRLGRLAGGFQLAAWQLKVQISIKLKGKYQCGAVHTCMASYLFSARSPTSASTTRARSSSAARVKLVSSD